MFELVNNKNYFHIKIFGKLTHEDYVNHLIPKLEEFMESHDQLNIFCEIKGLKGWEWQAAWDDFSIGIKHRKDFDKIAITSDQSWMRPIVKFFSLFIHGEIRFFDDKDKPKAQHWIEKASINGL